MNTTPSPKRPRGRPLGPPTERIILFVKTDLYAKLALYRERLQAMHPHRVVSLSEVLRVLLDASVSEALQHQGNDAAPCGTPEKAA